MDASKSTPIRARRGDGTARANGPISGPVEAARSCGAASPSRSA